MSDEQKKDEPFFDSTEEEDVPEIDKEPDEYQELSAEPPDDGIARRWYAIHTHSGQEVNVKKSLGVLAEQECRLDIDRHHTIPVLLRCLHHSGAQDHTGVVEEDVQTAQFADGLLNSTLAVGSQAYIAAHKDGPASLVDDGVGNTLTAGVIDVH